MNKTYTVLIAGQDRGVDISGPSARLALDTAMTFAEYNVKRGLHILVKCGAELVWDSAEAAEPVNIIPVDFRV